MFCEWHHKWNSFMPSWPTSSTLRPKLLDGSISLEINRYIYRPIFGFYRYITTGQNEIGISRSSENLRRKSKSRQLSYNNASRCIFINKQTRWTMEHVSAVTAETKASLRILQCLKLPHAGVVYEQTPVVLPDNFAARKVDWNLRCRSPINA